MAEGSKNKIVAALLALFLGGLGIHKFYLGQTVQGVIYLIFCWTGVPVLIGFVEAVLYLVSSDEAFAQKYG
ncbi:MAG: NINE protein [Proteobacteria bacterium]|nr:NINE protein [Pseudomonadota bacterium]MCP4920765.1 NINE protein [Pseudomonadota bacterium]